MAVACFHCGKTIMYGRSHTHHRGVAGGRWKKRAPKTQRLFKPNLQKVTILVAGKQKSVKLCTKCLKRIRKDIADGVKPFYQVLHYQTAKPKALPQTESSVPTPPVAAA